jgi:PPOX class probable FMN-dependent enzyme
MAMGYQITTEQQLRDLVGEPHELARYKSAASLSAPLRRYIELSPFLCLGTYGADGSCDLSPRGDAPGFVRIVDDHTLVIPDRPGNKRQDSIINIIHQPHVSLLFMIPGVLDTVRVNGTAIVTTDPALLQPCTVKGKTPSLAIVVTVEEALGHCSKAFRRSRLWQPDYVPTSGVPTLQEMISAHMGLDKDIRQMVDQAIEDDYTNNLY